MNPDDIQTTLITVSHPGIKGETLLQELEKLSEISDLKILLAHADDGIIWGELRNHKFEFSSSSPAFREETLQQIRVFGEKGELHLWRSENQWHTRLLVEGSGEEKESIEQCYLLWGDKVESVENGFSFLCHGSQGLRHAPPLIFPEKIIRSGLTVRHYLAEDEAGQMYINMTRLVSIRAF